MTAEKNDGHLPDARDEAAGVLLGEGVPRLVVEQRPARPVPDDLTHGTVCRPTHKSHPNHCGHCYYPWPCPTVVLYRAVTTPAHPTERAPVTENASVRSDEAEQDGS